MSDRACPIKKGGTTVSPSWVEGLTAEGFDLDPGGGCGTQWMRCEVCGARFGVFEDVGYHVPQYEWPRKCLRPAEGAQARG